MAHFIWTNDRYVCSSACGRNSGQPAEGRSRVYRAPGLVSDLKRSRVRVPAAEEEWRDIFFFFCRVNFLCWLLFQCPLHPYPRVTAVARKRSRSFCQNWSGGGDRIAQWLERRTRDWKVAGSNPCRSGRTIFFRRVDFLYWLLFRYPFHPRVTAVARKRSQSFCQKCRWQVTAKHAYTLRMWLCMKWHGAWLYGVHRTCAETAAVSCGASHVSAYVHNFGRASKFAL